MARLQPLLLHIELKFELDVAGYIVNPLARSIDRRYWKCCHGKRSLAFVILSEESSRELVRRLKLADITGIEDYSCYVAPIGAVTKHGGLSSLHSALNAAWDIVGGRRHPAFRDQSRRFDKFRDTRISNDEHGALRVRNSRTLDEGAKA